jgi:hypothetical protein
MTESALYKHALAFYDDMVKKAKPDEDGVLLYTGTIGKIYSRLGISMSYYSTIKRCLEDTGCITIIQKGVVNTPSIVALYRAPVPADLDLTEREKPATVLEAEVRAIAKNVGGIDIGEALLGLSSRLDLVEKELGIRRESGKSKDSSKRSRK